MINNNENMNFEDSGQGAKGPISSGKLKEYGKQAYGPLINVVHKYQDEFTPYLNALAKGLQGGVDALNKEGASDADKYVSQFFREASDGIREACQKVESKDVKDLTNYLTNLADKKPSIMFSTSYIAGLFFGRLGRHVLSKQKDKIKETVNSVTDSDQSFSTDKSSIDDFSSSPNITGPSSSGFDDEPPTFDRNIH